MTLIKLSQRDSLREAMKIGPEHWVFAVNAAQMLVDGKTPES